MCILVYWYIVYIYVCVYIYAYIVYHGRYDVREKYTVFVFPFLIERERERERERDFENIVLSLFVVLPNYLIERERDFNNNNNVSSERERERERVCQFTIVVGYVSKGNRTNITSNIVLSLFVVLPNYLRERERFQQQQQQRF
jgi:hypothetical protein